MDFVDCVSRTKSIWFVNFILSTVFPHLLRPIKYMKRAIKGTALRP